MMVADSAGAGLGLPGLFPFGRTGFGFAVVETGVGSGVNCWTGDVVSVAVSMAIAVSGAVMPYCRRRPFSRESDGAVVVSDVRCCKP